MKFFEQEETSEITSHQSLLPEVVQLMQQHHPQQGEAKVNKDLAMHDHKTDPGIQNIPERIIPLHKGLAQWKTLDQEKASLGHTWPTRTYTLNPTEKEKVVVRATGIMEIL
jgi:hypothetical protein